MLATYFSGFSVHKYIVYFALSYDYVYLIYTMLKCKLIHNNRPQGDGFTEFPSKGYTSVILCAFSFYLTD